MVRHRRAIALAAAAVVVAALGVVVASVATTIRPSGADDSPPPPTPTVLEQAAGAGRQWRLETPNGPVHVWAPAGYHADGAATVVYVHGYYTDVDQAWDDHRLAEQFALSSINALFIVPEAPAHARNAVSWPELTALLTEVFGRIDVARPMGALVAVGHSGGYRTVDRWLDQPGLDEVIAVDSVYGDVDDLEGWLAGSPAHRLIMIGDDTLEWTEQLARDLGDDVVTLDRFPEDDDGIPPEAHAARVFYVRSQYGHMPLVTGGVALPMMLRLVPAEILADAPWHQPYGLPPRPIDAGVDGGGR
ncbi:MAG TPA: hypothetical protein VHE35_35040 [Kofleriaceae bacterium]|nr:hypothetical protein [Kofleriaceae bacterium]